MCIHMQAHMHMCCLHFKLLEVRNMYDVHLCPWLGSVVIAHNRHSNVWVRKLGTGLTCIVGKRPRGHHVSQTVTLSGFQWGRWGCQTRGYAYLYMSSMVIFDRMTFLEQLCLVLITVDSVAVVDSDEGLDSLLGFVSSLTGRISH